jgi:S1-C subfamily serine protease
MRKFAISIMVMSISLCLFGNRDRQERLLAYSPSFSHAQQEPVTQNPTTLAKNITPAIVYIKGITSDGQEIGGSGFIVDASGLIVTNLHIIKDLKAIAVRLLSGDIYDQVVVKAFDERKDLAVIKVPGFDLPVVTLGNSNLVQQGDSVLVIGNPLGLEASVSAGIVSGIRKLEEGLQVFQTDAAANPGNSGGPMLNMNGAVIGVLTFKMQNAENLNFVVPINYARGLISAQESMSLDALRKRLGQAIEIFKDSKVSIPSQWRSLQSGTTKILRLEGEHLYVETEIPEELKKLGNFVLADMKKDGDKFVGTVKNRFTCQYSDAWSGQARYNTCEAEYPIEITLFTENRIEGWTMSYAKGDKLSCRKCTHSTRPIKETFVWIPL